MKKEQLTLSKYENKKRKELESITNEWEYVCCYDRKRGAHIIKCKNYPSIDHIKPLSKGGVHQWDNVQLAHRICNTMKRDHECL